ncbi:MAG: phosphoadenylyl-sulfate reductase, partial [Chloroflexota bacterium]
MATKTLTPAELEELNRRFVALPPQEVIAWGFDRFHPNMVLSSSFGVEDVALIDMMWRINPAVRVVTLDTLRLHTETYSVIDAIRERYGIKIEIFYPDISAVDRMVHEVGYNCFYQSVDNRKRCCGIRKVEPLDRALAGARAWVSGLRRDQAVTRTATGAVEIDEVHGGIVKLNPLVEWTADDVWSYVRKHDVPYNALHDHGFPSIGCAPCTRPVEPGEDPRAGRWLWE